MAEQKDLEGKRVQTDVEKEERVSTTLIFWHGHFMLKISAGALDKIQDMDDPAARRKKLAKRIIARPDAEEIPEGAKAKESEDLVTAALHQFG